MSARSGSMTARETSPKPAEDRTSLIEKGAAPPAPPPAPGAKQLLFCFIGLQASYLTWGYVQEKVMTKEYSTGRFPSATFCVCNCSCVTRSAKLQKDPYPVGLGFFLGSSRKGF